jgi:hypothetical protein
MHREQYLYAAILVSGALMVLGVALQVVKGCIGFFKLKRNTRIVPETVCRTTAIADRVREGHDALVALPTVSSWGLLRTADGQLKSARQALATPGWTPPNWNRGGVALN